jgi:hypothetical protein
VELGERSKKNYAEMLRSKLRTRTREHAERIDSLSDDEIIRQDAQHSQHRVEAVRVKFEAMRRRAHTDVLETRN